jgi:thioredoxin-dependent peroxiredoxin
MALTVGTKAPDFSLPSTPAGGAVSLASLAGKTFVLYFYPKDDTPGCTVEACDFRDNLGRVQSAGALVFGVSKDTLASHQRFQEKHALPFPLLADQGSAVAKAYGAYGEKVMYGRKVEGTIRSTFVIGPDGVVQHAWSPVKVAGHVDAVLAALEGRPAAAAKAAPKAGSKKAAKKSSAKVAKAAPSKAPKKVAKKGAARRAAARKPGPKRAAKKQAAPKKQAAKKQPSKARRAGRK